MRKRLMLAWFMITYQAQNLLRLPIAGCCCRINGPTNRKKNDRPAEPSLIFKRALCTASCVSNQLVESWAIAYKKLSRFLEQKVRTNESKTVSATTGTSGKFKMLATSKHARVYVRRNLLAYLVIRKERVELAFDYDTSLYQNVLFKMVHREEFQEEMFFENRTYSKVIDKELPFTLQLYRKLIELSLVNQTEPNNIMSFDSYNFSTINWFTQVVKTVGKERYISFTVDC